MSLTLVCLYIIIVLCFLLFVNYKFLKLFITTPNQKYTHDANSNNATIANKNSTISNHNNNNNINDNVNDQFKTSTMSMSTNDIWSIPGPLKIPFLGTKWIYLWKYKLSKIHEVYRGTVSPNRFNF